MLENEERLLKRKSTVTQQVVPFLKKVTNIRFVIIWEVFYFCSLISTFTVVQSEEFLSLFDLEYSKLLDYCGTVYLCGFFFGFIIGWLADSYARKSLTALVGQSISMLAPVTCYLAFEKYFGTLMVYFTIYLVACFTAFQSVRTALILEQVGTTDEETLRMFVIVLVWIRNIAKLIPAVQHNSYDFNEGYCLAMIVMALIYLILFSITIWLTYKPEQIEFMVMEKCFFCAYKALITKYKKNSLEHKDNWVDYAENHCKQNIIHDVKVIYQLFITLLPFICYGTTYSFWKNINEWHTHQLFNNNSFLKHFDGSVGLYCLICLVLPISEIILYVVCQRYSLLHSFLHRLTFGYFLVGLALIISTVLEVYFNHISTAHIPEAGLGRVTFYNTNPVKVTIFSFWNDTAIFEPYMSISVVKPVEFEPNLYFVSEELNLNGTYIVLLDEGESISLVIMASGLRRISDYDPIYPIQQYMNYPTQPQMYMIGSSLNITGDLKLENKFGISYKFHYSTELEKSIYPIAEQTYQVIFERNRIETVDPDQVVSMKIDLATLYVVALCPLNLEEKSPIIPVFHSIKINVFIPSAVLFIPMLLAAFGESMARISLMTFTFKEAPVHLRTTVMTYTNILLHTEPGIFSMGTQLSRPTVYTLALIAFIHIVCLFPLFHLVLSYSSIKDHRKRSSTSVELQMARPSKRESKIESTGGSIATVSTKN